MRKTKKNQQLSTCHKSITLANSMSQQLNKYGGYNFVQLPVLIHKQKL